MKQSISLIECSYFMTMLKKVGRFAVDTETNAMDAMRADLAGISFCWKAGEAFYLPTRTPLGTKHLELKSVKKLLAPILADKNTKKIG